MRTHEIIQEAFDAIEDATEAQIVKLARALGAVAQGGLVGRGAFGTMRVDIAHDEDGEPEVVDFEETSRTDFVAITSEAGDLVAGLAVLGRMSKQAAQLGSDWDDELIGDLEVELHRHFQM